MSARTIELRASAAAVSSGNTDWFSVETLREAAVGVDITAVSGTTPDLTLWLDFTDDDGTTYYEAVADQVLQSSDAAAPNTVNKEVRDIVDGATAVGRYLAHYKSLAASKVRLRWIISGTTPSFTFSASLVGK